MNKLMHGDCIELMKCVPDESVDMVLCDLPYGVLNKGNRHAAWDCQLPMDQLWNSWLRICRPNAAIILFAQGMFTAKLMLSMQKLWRYNLVWKKGGRITGFLNANRMPCRNHEDIVVFYSKQPVYNPQFTYSKKTHSCGFGEHKNTNRCYGSFKRNQGMVTNRHYPLSVININKEHKGFYHPTQKPVALLAYLIRTYTNEGATVLDCCMGSGSTGVACVETGRNFIGIEKDAHYFDVATIRMDKAMRKGVQLTFNFNSHENGRLAR